VHRASRRWIVPLLFLVAAVVVLGVFVAHASAPAPAAEPGPLPTAAPTASEDPATPTPATAAATSTRSTARSAARSTTALPTAAVETDPPATVATDPPVRTTGEVTVVVTSADWDAAGAQVEATAFVSGVLEPGTCTLTLTSGATTVTAQSPAAPDATTTTCAPVDVPRSRLSAGTWQAVVSYRSSTSEGTSSASQVVVP
jgi:Na+-transporting methylmalonyl-CoA/oxaloacetate decarboxylase gamma subunit